MKPTRVLIIVENLPVPFDRRVWLEATTLREHGYHVSVICPKGRGFENAFETIDGIDVYRHPLPIEASGGASYILEYGAALFWQTILTLKILLRGGIDIIHACNPPDLIFLIAAPLKLFGVKFIFDQHDLCPEVYESKFAQRGLTWQLLRALERATFFAADVVISTNESYRSIAMARGKVAPERIFVVRSGPDIRKWPHPPPGNKAFRNGKKHLVAYLGVMGQQEGIDLLLSAAEKLIYQRDVRDIQFLLIGDGSARAELERLRDNLNLNEYVTFTGRISDADMISAIGEADICVNPDKPSELNDKSTMNKIVEYMALGKPIVQFDLSEGRYSALDASLYANPGDIDDFATKIETLLGDEALRLKMGSFGRHRVETALAWEHQVPRLLGAYHAVFGARS